MAAAPAPVAPPLLRRRRARTVVGGSIVGALLAGFAATAPAAAAPAPANVSATPSPVVKYTYRPTAADRRMNSALTSRVTTTRFGTAFGGTVIDVKSNTVVWSKGGSTGYMPASSTKWVTATNALTVFGPSHRFTTVVRRGGQADQVVLVGSGDPAFSSSQLSALATTTASAMKARGQTSVRLYVDDYLFPAPTLATGWRSTAVPYDTTWLRALVVDGSQATDTTMDAANKFTAKLRANGLTVSLRGRGRASTANPVLASSAGRTMTSIVATMMNWSDNEYAEALHRLVAIRLGAGNTWTAAKSAQAAQMTKQGLTINALYDGSGLSRSDRLTSTQLTRIVMNAFEPGNVTPLRILRSDAGLPVSGRTGTLSASYDRFVTASSKCAVGKVHAKTGTLSDAVSLTGFTWGADGRLKAFSFVVNGRSSTLALKQNVDMLAATVTGCY